MERIKRPGSEQEPDRLIAPEPAAIHGGEREAQPLDYCPNCSEKLASQHCKMICPRCGFFLSCSDYY